MKAKQLKKVLSITLASAVILSAVPVSPVIVEAESEAQKQEKETKEKTVAASQTEENKEEKPVEEKIEEKPVAETKNETENKDAAENKDTAPAPEKKETTSEKEAKATEAPKKETKSQAAADTDQKDTETGSTDQKDTTDTNNPSKDTNSDQKDPSKDETKKTQVEVSWKIADKSEFTWDGTVHPATDSKDYTLTITRDGNLVQEIKEPGVYTVTASTTDETKEITNPTITFTVKKVEVASFTWNGLSAVYTGKAVAHPTATFPNADKTVGGEVNATVSYTSAEDLTDGEAVNAGTYTVKAELSEVDQAHYVFTGSDNDKQNTLSVVACDVVVTPDSIVKVYGEEKAFTTSVSCDDSELKASVEDYINSLSNGFNEIPNDDVNEDGYEISLTEETKTALTEKYGKNLSFSFGTGLLKVTPLDVVIEPKEGLYKYYGGEEPTFGDGDYSVSIETASENNRITPDLAKAELDGTLTREEGEDVLISGENDTNGNYLYKFESKNNNYNVTVDETVTFEIKKLPVEITPSEGQWKYYKQTDDDVFEKTPLSYTVAIKEKDRDGNSVSTEKKANDVNKEMAGILVRDGNKDEENAGNHFNYKFNTQNTNYEITINKSVPFTIKALPILVIPESGMYKIYGLDDPEEGFPYEVEISNDPDTGEVIDPAPKSKGIKAELGDLTREKGEDVYFYTYLFEKENKNYDVTIADIKYEIRKCDVTIIPDDLSKIYGQNDPDITWSYNSIVNTEKVEDELNSLYLYRNTGESLGSYDYNIGYSNNDEDFFSKNYNLEINGSSFVVKHAQIESVSSINSRQGTFAINTNISDRNPEIPTSVQVKATFPGSKDGITFSTNIDDYIGNLDFKTQNGEFPINTMSYGKKGKDNKEYKWNGKLPAGTKLEISIIGVDGEIVSKESKIVTVNTVPVTLSAWSGYQSGMDGNFTVANNGKSDALNITGDRAGELVEVKYNNGGKDSYTYKPLNASFTPTPNNSGSSHLKQSVTANIVDTLNFTYTPQSLNFYVDDQAFPISSSAIQFENRGKEIKIQLPEAGTITNVSIDGATIKPTGNVAKEFTLPAKWSGKKLIPTGASISVKYKDEAGHEGSGTSSATRSSVSTPITFKIRPELNANGYLNGQSSRLIVSGAACSCEPIRVTVANSSQETYATQLDTWSDSNGSWETVFDMAGLPEKQDFTISAEYTDVNGSPYSITAKYEAFCSPADVTSPIYEAMSHISGMVEPGTAVALVVNGKKQKYYEFDVDRFGRISLDDVPMMFGGEDSFDIYVQDIAGNVAIKHYDIPEPEDPFEVKAQVNPLGKYFFKGDAETSSSYAATPISLKDFEKDKDTLEIPLILGMSYDVGKLTIQKKGNGIVINSSLDLGKNVDKEDYKVTEEQLYVYTTKPSEADIKDNKGKAYKYGEEIPLSKDGTIWIADKKEITVLADAMEELELFKYDESKAYEKYQEQ